MAEEDKRLIGGSSGSGRQDMTCSLGRAQRSPTAPRWIPAQAEIQSGDGSRHYSRQGSTRGVCCGLTAQHPQARSAASSSAVPCYGIRPSGLRGIVREGRITSGNALPERPAAVVGGIGRHSYYMDGGVIDNSAVALLGWHGVQRLGMEREEPTLRRSLMLPHPEGSVNASAIAATMLGTLSACVPESSPCARRQH